MKNAIFIEFPEAEKEELHINNFGRSVKIGRAHV